MVKQYREEFEKLNEYQKQAVVSEDRALLVNAAVGSGKTTVLVHKVLYLHIEKKVPLEQILILTFTNRATREMKERLLAFKDELAGELRYIGTFHSIGRMLLNEARELSQLGYRPDFEIIDNDRGSEVLTGIIEEKRLKIKYKSKLLKRVEEYKNGRPLYGVMKYEDDIQRLVEYYRAEKQAANLMDFDDIIDNCIKLCQLRGEALGAPEWIIIDEFQDTDLEQLQMIQGLCGKQTHLFCVGDPNQIIYSWRTGAEDIFNEYRKVFQPVELSLPVNYRSTRTIIEASNALLYGTQVVGMQEFGEKIILRSHYDAFNEAHFIASEITKWKDQQHALRDIAVLFRRQAQLEILENVFSTLKIPYRCLGNRSYGNQGEAQLMDEDADAVNLLTLHASKGLEFSYVFIIGANVGNIPLSNKRNDEPEELRLFYVGMTRAKARLEISYLKKPGLPGMQGYRSAYLSLLPKELVISYDEEASHSINELMGLLREERALKLEERKKQVKHAKYGVGTVLSEDEDVIQVEFEQYGVKEFTKLFCPLEPVDGTGIMV